MEVEPMTIYKLKLDIRFWQDVKSGKKNWEIRNNDRDFHSGDILKLRAFRNGQYVRWSKNKRKWGHTTARKAETITVKVTTLIRAQALNEGEWDNDTLEVMQTISWSDVMITLVEYFDTDYFPERYVLMKISVL